MQTRRPLAWSIGLVAALAAAIGCGTPRTRPEEAPSFHHISDEQLESAMWRLAAGVRRLQDILGADEPVTPARRAEVVDVLDEMVAAADSLGPNALETNHPRLTHGLARFREQLRIARRSVADDPPRYYLAGNLSGTCLACHAVP